MQDISTNDHTINVGLCTGSIYIAIPHVISLFAWKAERVNAISHFLEVLNIPPLLVVHLVFVSLVIGIIVSKTFVLSKVAPQPESSRICSSRLQSLALGLSFQGTM
jgi:hypothetical protein